MLFAKAEVGIACRLGRGEDAVDYARHSADGDVASMDLEAVSIAANLMGLTGAYETAYLVLDILLQ